MPIAATTSVTHLCGKCGSKLFADAPKGFCSLCLFNAAVAPLLEEAVDFAQVPTKFGDYELLEEIGRGGQGVVYRARQKSLNRTVALKVIGLGTWATEAHLKRFRREAEAAARLQHPGIVPIHEVGERDSRCYFSMDFIEGGQLDEVVRRTPLPIRQAAELVAKVARTVHYAHEHGILHRDIKPGNILLDKNGEPHLTDFGLARLVETESTLTRTKDLMGTPSYMAPEQAVGDNAKITKATDVYGLGAVLYQLLTGHPPFAGGTTYETIKLLLDTEPRSPRSLNPKIDRDLSTICLKCLEKDAKRRYSSALALTEDLEHWLKHEPILARHSGIVARGAKWVRRNPTRALLAAALIALAAVIGWNVWQSESIRPPITNGIAVLPFQNLSADPDQAYFAEAIQDEILTRLASIAGLKVISRTSTQRYQSKPSNLAEIAKQLGVANILEGSVQKAADQVRVNVQLINGQTDSHLWAETYDRKLSDIFGVESEIAKGVAESLQAKLSGREQQALAVKPTKNPEAYDAYLRGLAFEARGNLFPDLIRKATVCYERAVQFDHNFAIGWARLSRSNAYLWFNGSDNTPAIRRDGAKRALDNAQKLEPNSPETLLGLGYYQYWVLRDYGLAKATFGRVSEMLPNSSQVPEALALITRREGNWDQSTAYFEQALTLDPRNVDLLTNAASTYAILRQFPAALKLYDRALDIGPNDPEVMASKASIYQAQGNLQEAARLLSDVNWQTPAGDALGIKVIQLRLERNYTEAIRVLQARQTQFHFLSDFEKSAGQVYLALLQRLAGDIAGAKASAEQARNACQQLQRGQPDNAWLMENLSLASAVAGEKDLALKEAERAVMLLPRARDAVTGPSFEENLALIQTIFGDSSRAIATLTALLQTPYEATYYGRTPATPALLRLDPLWDPLRTDPAFQKLCEEKLDKSIAVLPFENLSGDPNNAYFADGIQDEILRRLATIADLKVISRTSAERYRDEPRDLAEIAKQLGVANILEGTVQKAADQVRVNVQLIKAETDSHLWAESYDRKMTDILGVESEIAKRIAESLQAKLTGREEQALAVKVTNNPDAYDAYLAGRVFASEDETEKALRSYQKAVEFDPNFALGWAGLSSMQSLAHWELDSSPERVSAAKAAMDRALALDPNLPEVHLALGYYRYYVLRDFTGALSELRQAGQALPNDTDVIKTIAMVQRRLGQWDEALAGFRRVVELDPRDVDSYGNLAMTYEALRRFPEALAAFNRALSWEPVKLDSEGAWKSLIGSNGAWKSLLLMKADALWATGDLQSKLPYESAYTIGFMRAGQALLKRNYAEAKDILSQALADKSIVTQSSDVFENREILVLILGLTQQRAGDVAAARATYQQVVRDSHHTLESVSPGSPAETQARVNLAWAYAGLGEADSAIEQGRKAMAIMPSSKDAYRGPKYEENIARIYALLGDADHAVPILDRLLHIPYLAPLTSAKLRTDPTLDQIRNNAAFQKLCEEKQPPAAP